MRKELNSGSQDKSDLARQLRDIKEKVRRLEEDKEAEIDRCRRDLEESIMNDKKSTTIADELNKRVVMLKAQLDDQCKKCERLSNDVVDTNQAKDKIIDDLINAKAIVSNKLSECSSTITGLRDDIDAYISKIQTLEQKILSLEHTLSCTTADNEALAREISFSKDNCTRADDVSRKQLMDREAEIEGLKDCIRRECEERTGLLIEISELKDDLLRYESSSSSNKSNKDTCDASHQVSDHHQQSHYMPSVKAGVAGASGDSKHSLVKGDTPDTDIQPFLKTIAASASFGSILACDDDGMAACDNENAAIWSNSIRRQGARGRGKRK